MNAKIDAKNVVTPKSCIGPTGEIAGSSNFAIASLGVLTCDAKGTCKGVLPLAITNPCPTVDSETQIASLDVFDGPDFATIDANNSGVILKACCGRAEYVIPGAKSADQPACQGKTQDVLGSMGNVIQIKQFWRRFNGPRPASTLTLLRSRTRSRRRGACPDRQPGRARAWYRRTRRASPPLRPLRPRRRVRVEAGTRRYACSGRRLRSPPPGSGVGPASAVFSTPSARPAQQPHESAREHGAGGHDGEHDLQPQ